MFFGGIRQFRQRRTADGTCKQKACKCRDSDYQGNPGDH